MCGCVRVYVWVGACVFACVCMSVSGGIMCLHVCVCVCVFNGYFWFVERRTRT